MRSFDVDRDIAAMMGFAALYPSSHGPAELKPVRGFEKQMLDSGFTDAFLISRDAPAKTKS